MGGAAEPGGVNVALPLSNTLSSRLEIGLIVSPAKLVILPETRLAQFPTYTTTSSPIYDLDDSMVGSAAYKISSISDLDHNVLRIAPPNTVSFKSEIWLDVHIGSQASYKKPRTHT